LEGKCAEGKEERGRDTSPRGEGLKRKTGGEGGEREGEERRKAG